MSEFKIPDFGCEMTFKSEYPFIQIYTELKEDSTSFDLTLEQAKELVSYLNDKIALAENKKIR